MIVRYTSIIGSTVAELRDQTKIGRISEVIIDDSSISIAAIAVDMPFWSFQKDKFVLNIDIVHLLKDGIMINDIESIVDLDESIQLEKLIKRKVFGINQRVETSSGTYIGYVYDFLIETGNLAIVKFYIKHLFAERIISADKVISINGKIIRIKDNFTSNKISSMATVDAISTN